jgi:predicted outer membrane protein
MLSPMTATWRRRGSSSRRRRTSRRRLLDQQRHEGERRHAHVDAVEIREHQQVLDTIDNKLIPQEQNAELRSALQDAREKVASHLNMARDIRSFLP